MTVRSGAHGSGGPAGGAIAVPWGDAWTPAHSEAARFLGECVAVGAVLGFLTELTRLVGESRPRRGASRPRGAHPGRVRPPATPHSTAWR